MVASDDIAASVRQAMRQRFRGSLLAKGEAQALIRRGGELGEDAPDFPAMLDYDLQTFAFGLLDYGLQLAETEDHRDLGHQAVARSAEALEASVKNVSADESSDFFRLTAAVASHIGGFAAKAYSLIATVSDSPHLTSGQQVLARLLLRDLPGLEEQIGAYKNSGISTDRAITRAFKGKRPPATHSTPDDSPSPVDLALTDNLMSALAESLFAFQFNDEDAYNSAIDLIELGGEVSRDLSLASSWWTHRLTALLLRDLWGSGLRQNIPNRLEDVSSRDWTRSRETFVASLYRRPRAEMDLWPSQVVAARQVFDSTSNLVVSLPTSSGKTRIAELCALETLARGKRVVYITPLRALSAQTEATLGNTFQPLGVSVSSLYGAAGTGDVDEDILRNRDIVVGTPEKLDFALRSDPTLLNDVGLVVLDEGHMIGAGEREVRFEMQIQRLLRRSDAADRRIVCLSAVFPDGHEIQDFTDWLTDDDPDGLVASDWRPTRLRFGTVEWHAENARLAITVGDETPFISRFITSTPPPIGRRRTAFPNSQRELCIATAWTLATEGETVMVFCPERRAVEPYAASIIKLIEQGGLEPLAEIEGVEIDRALAVGMEWFPEDHPILACLKVGVAVHHGTLPTPYRRAVERLMRNGQMKVIIASPTLAQGLNLSATTVVFHGLNRGRTDISGADFSNVVGRAGRAYVDSEGLALFPMWKPTQAMRRRWIRYSTNQADRFLQSGLLGTLRGLLRRYQRQNPGANLEDLLAFVTGSAEWTFPTVPNEAARDAARALSDWYSLLASMDTAILSSFGEEEPDDDGVIEALDLVLTRSLWERQLARLDDRDSDTYRALLHNRADLLWSNSNATQRRGWYLSGVGMRTGQALDEIAESVLALMVQVDVEVAAGDLEAATTAVIDIAEQLFTVDTFAPRDMPDGWREILTGWVNGLPLVEISDSFGLKEVQFIESDLVYRLVWGMEAVRVHQTSLGSLRVDLLDGSALAAVETGTFDRRASTLIRAGFDFRSGAIAAISESDADFTDAAGARRWVREEHQTRLDDPSWPTAASRGAWVDFVTGSGARKRSGQWRATRIPARVRWTGTKPVRGTRLRVLPRTSGFAHLATPGFDVVGELRDLELNLDYAGALSAVVVKGGVDVRYLGPRDLLTDGDRGRE